MSRPIEGRIGPLLGAQVEPPIEPQVEPQVARRRLLAGAALLGTLAACSKGKPAPTALERRAAAADVVAGLPGGWAGIDAARGHRLREPAAWSAASGRERCEVAIVGAGIAGLAALRALVGAGIDDVRLLELEDAAGGNARAGRLGGIDCPLGAHYLPLPDERNHALLECLGEFGLWHWQSGRRAWNERHLCHSPQERLYIDGHWIEGLLPAADAAPGLRAELQRMSELVAQAARVAEYRIPTRLAGWSAPLAALDGISFDAWLDAQRLHQPLLRAYLDYCCRDDYGASSAMVSAWAGLHYFASRHGFAGPEGFGDGDAAPGTGTGDDPDLLLTWPQGNAWLAQRLAAPRAAHIDTGQVALALRPARDGIELLIWSAPRDQLRVVAARQAVLALPLYAALRLLEQPPPALRAAVGGMCWAPWLVSNLLLEQPLQDGPGAAPAWDNVIHASGSLGYVDATHQSLDPAPGAAVLTHYWALGGRSAAELAAAREGLLRGDWRDHAAAVLQDIALAQPDVLHKVRRIELVRYGHAMSVPRPGVRGAAALAALCGPAPGERRIHFAHSDLSGYSVFEEAFFHGERAAADVVRARRSVRGRTDIGSAAG